MFVVSAKIIFHSTIKLLLKLFLCCLTLHRTMTYPNNSNLDLIKLK